MNNIGDMNWDELQLAINEYLVDKKPIRGNWLVGVCAGFATRFGGELSIIATEEIFGACIKDGNSHILYAAVDTTLEHTLARLFLRSVDAVYENQ